MKRADWILLGTVTGLFVVAFGCGGTGDADGLFNSGAASGAGGAATGTSTSGSTSGGPGTTTTTSSASGNTTTSSSSGGKASSSSSSSTGASSSSSAASSSSSSGGGPTVPCGAMMCPAGPMAACCWDNFQKDGVCVTGTPQTDNCNTDVGPGGFHTRLECQNASDCPGTLCCGHVTQGGGQGYYPITTCQAACANTVNNVQLCDPNAPNACQQGQCGQSQLLPQGYFVCK